jgi:hypothetical protein
MIGRKSISARMSRCRSTPGAISVSSNPVSLKPKTQRSVTIKHGLVARRGVGAAERAVLDALHELGIGRFHQNT